MARADAPAANHNEKKSLEQKVVELEERIRKLERLLAQTNGDRT
jgi:hypothetical protein